MKVEIKGYHITAGCNRRESWKATARIKDKQRTMVANALWVEQVVKGHGLPALPVIVTFTRIAPRPLDDDNLSNAFKHVRDEVACWLGLPQRRQSLGQKWGVADDRDPRVIWMYDQMRRGAGEYAVEIRVEARA